MAVIINSVLREVGSIGKPHNGKNGIGNKIISQIPPSEAIIFHLCLSLERSIPSNYLICKLTFSWNNRFTCLTYFCHGKYIQTLWLVCLQYKRLKVLSIASHCKQHCNIHLLLRMRKSCLDFLHGRIG